MVKEKSRETRLRHTLARRGYTLSKSRRRDPNALGFGKYNIVTGAGIEMTTLCWELTLDEVEQWTLTEPARRARRTGKS